MHIYNCVYIDVCLCVCVHAPIHSYYKTILFSVNLDLEKQHVKSIYCCCCYFSKPLSPPQQLLPSGVWLFVVVATISKLLLLFANTQMKKVGGAGGKRGCVWHSFVFVHVCVYDNKTTAIPPKSHVWYGVVSEQRYERTNSTKCFFWVGQAFLSFWFCFYSMGPFSSPHSCTRPRKLDNLPTLLSPIGLQGSHVMLFLKMYLSLLLVCAR